MIATDYRVILPGTVRALPGTIEWPGEPGFEAINALVKPLIGGGITSARGEVNCPYGRIVSDWRLEGGEFLIEVEVPVSCECLLTLPDGSESRLLSGSHSLRCKLD